MRGDKREQIKCWLQGCPDTFNPDINSNKIDIFKIPSLHQACFFLCFFLFLENVAEDDARSIDSIRHYYSVWPACWIVFSLLVFLFVSLGHNAMPLSYATVEHNLYVCSACGSGAPGSSGSSSLISQCSRMVQTFAALLFISANPRSEIPRLPNPKFRCSHRQRTCV